MGVIVVGQATNNDDRSVVSVFIANTYCLETRNVTVSGCGINFKMRQSLNWVSFLKRNL